MKTSELLMGLATLIIVTIAVVWIAHRAWYGRVGRAEGRAIDRPEDDPVLWI